MSKYPTPRNPSGKGGFQKGQSGNPGGRPKEVADIRELARVHTLDAVKCLASIVRSGRSEMARITAANSILDRAYGRPAQALEHSGPDGQPLTVNWLEIITRATYSGSNGSTHHAGSNGSSVVSAGDPRS